MKKYIATSVLSLLMLSSCVKKDKITSISTEPINSNSIDIPFSGDWEREFETGPGIKHKANYHVYKDSIRYKLAGIFVNRDYVMLRDTFLNKENKFIGHTSDNQYYVLFAKDVSENTVTIYKQEIKNVEEGLKITQPADNTTESHGWNTFQKSNN